MTKRLTFRERQIVAHVLYGYGNKQIAGELFLSVATVRVHLKSAYRKLEIQGKFKRQQLAFMFFGNQEKRAA